LASTGIHPFHSSQETIMQIPVNALITMAMCSLGGLVSSARAAEVDQQTEGHWKVVSIEKDGKLLPEELVTRLPGIIVIEAGKIRGMLGDKQIYEADFVVNTKSSPKTYEMAGGKDRKGRDVVTRGIYEIDAKGRLRKCFNTGKEAVAPRSFDTTKTPGSQTIVYERVK
jgi:uncharacterized protein (TIGR03067 family)